MATQVAQLRSINPYTEEEIESFDVSTEREIDAALNAAHAASQGHDAHGWRDTTPAQRATLLRRVAGLLRDDTARHALSITREMGKPLAESRAEVEKCAVACDYVADNLAMFLADEPAPSDSASSFIAFEPLGTVLACMPWNFPYWQVFRCAAFGIGAGNCVVLKHANNVTRCALNLAELFAAAGFPPGVFATLVLPVETVADLIADPRIAAVSLTGSTAAGRSVGRHAGEHLKKCVLELGGSDAFVVLDDADLDEAAKVGARSRFQNAGQSCIAAKRFIVMESVAGDFVERFVAEAERMVLGDPCDDRTTMGPLARRDLVQSLERQLNESVRQGARLRTGGTRPDRGGCFFTPTVIDRCDAETSAFHHETFGPLAAVATVASEADALQLANHSMFGLGGNVWTRDLDRGLHFARRLESGGVFINGMTHSDPRIPFGGVKESGYGRELHRSGMLEFVNLKTIWLPRHD